MRTYVSHYYAPTACQSNSKSPSHSSLCATPQYVRYHPRGACLLVYAVVCAHALLQQGSSST